jgi:hypothetical protein
MFPFTVVKVPTLLNVIQPQIIKLILALQPGLKKRLYRVHNVTDMEREIMDIWQTIPLHYIRNLYRSLSTRMLKIRATYPSIEVSHLFFLDVMKLLDDVLDFR